MKAACLLLLLSTSAAFGQTVSVRSGDHPGFTRLALDLPAGKDWRFGRIDGGYALAVEGVALDISRVFRVIGRQRLARLTAHEGRLELGIDCACHVTAFETRRGTVALDIRPGAAPAGSPHEARLEPPSVPQTPPQPAEPPATEPAPQPKPGYDWRALPATEQALAPTAIDPLREALLRELADGAARGIVDIAERIPPQPPSPPMPDQIRIAEEPGFLPDPSRPITPEGRSCIADDRVAIGDWGSDLPPAEEIARARAGLVGEFDQPDPEAIGRAIRYYLHLGFGAEARQLAATYPIDPHDRALWEAMANILEGRPQSTEILASMGGCDSTVALWGILANPAPPIGQPEDTNAALRSFTALPQHMRQHLGPQLAERFAARHDANAAMMVREAIERGSAPPTAEIRLMTALADRNDAQLQTLIDEGSSQSGAALIALAARKLDAAQKLNMNTVTALAALRHERRGSEDEAQIARLHLLGLASLGDFEGAFLALRATPDAEPELWTWLAREGGDSAVLTHAVLPAGAALPTAPAETRLQIADRLTGLGLAGPALVWLERGDKLAAASPEERLAAAEALMLQRDARQVLPLIAGLQGEAAESLRIAALAQLEAPSPTLPEATALLTPPTLEGGALARSRAMVDEAADARARIDALLRGVQVPQ